MLRFIAIAMMVCMVEMASAFGMARLPTASKLYTAPVLISRQVPRAQSKLSGLCRMSDTKSNDGFVTKYSDLASKPAMIAGDTTVFLIFAAIGRMNHASSEGSIFLTAAPFIASWLAFAPILNGFKESSSRTQALVAIALPLAATLPCAILLRGLIQGYMPAPSFWVVALVATSLLLTIWRLIYFQATSAMTTVDKFVEAILDDDE